MTFDFENQLKRALAPVAAPPGFAERVMRALPKAAPTAVVIPIASREPRARRGFWMPAALAASLLAAVVLGRYVATDVQHRNEQAAGRAASRELMEALRVTSKKLDLAYEAVKKQPKQEDEEDRT